LFAYDLHKTCFITLGYDYFIALSYMKQPISRFPDWHKISPTYLPTLPV